MNDLDQPFGDEVAGWTGVERPSRTLMEGRFCRIESLATEHHLSDLFEAYSDDTDGKLWTYMTDGPFNSIDELRKWMEPACAADDPLYSWAD